MKFTTKLFLTWMSIFLIFYIAVISILSLFWGIEISFIKLAIVFFIAGVVPPAVITMFFYKRLDYMESEDINPPNFKGQKKVEINCSLRSSKNHFDEIMHRIDKTWIISFSDRENKILKFRTDTRTLSWGVGGYVKLNDDNSVTVIVYPMHADSRREEKYLYQTLRLMRVVLNPRRIALRSKE